MWLKNLSLLLSIFSLSHAKDLSNLDSRFIQRWHYMSIADFAYQNSSDSGTNGRPFHNETPFNPKDVFPGSIIFITGHSAPDFFKLIHPKIENPYIMIYTAGGLNQKFLDDPKIIHFFCAGGDYDGTWHPKYSLMPLGFSNQCRSYRKGFFDRYEQKPKNKLVYMNFSLHPCTPWRRDIYNIFNKLPYVFTQSQVPFANYLEEMSNYKFVLSPSGDVHDCFRHWEAIAVGSIPIVKRSHIVSLLEELPVWIVDDWSEIASLTEEALHAKYREIKSKVYDYSKLYLRYWVDQINEIKTVHGY